MSRTDCCSVLGVSPHASWEVVRQAYRDLVRVWHPDRFQSDPELQRKAEQQLRKINEAYFALRDAEPLEAAEAPRPAAPPAPPPQCNTPNDTRPATASPRQYFPLLRAMRWPVKLAWIAALCAAPLILGGVILEELRVPSVDSLALPNGFQRPGIGDSATGGSTGAGSGLSHWARSRASELFGSIGGRSGEAWRPTSSVSSPASSTARVENAGTPEAPVNGTELIRGRTLGGSQIWISNPNSQDAVATLRESDTASAVRSIYVKAGNKACLRRIAPGVYSLTAELGEGWDARQHRFAARLKTLRHGPLQCMDLSSAHAVSGQCFEVNPAEDTSRPMNSVVLGTR